MNDSELLRAVRAAAADDFDVLGEIARDGVRMVVYLARELTSSDLVALKLIRGEPDAAGQDEYSLEVARELDPSMPDIESHCQRCGNKLRRWARFCTQCGLDVSGVGPSSAENLSRDTLRNAVRAAAASEFDVLGEMPRAEGGGLIYFARNRTTNAIVALRLQRQSDSEYALDVTRVLKPVKSSPLPIPQPERPPVDGVTDGNRWSRPAVDRPASRPEPGLPLQSGSANQRPWRFDFVLGALRHGILANVHPLVLGSVLLLVVVLLVYLIVRAVT